MIHPAFIMNAEVTNKLIEEITKHSMLFDRYLMVSEGATLIMNTYGHVNHPIKIVAFNKRDGGSLNPKYCGIQICGTDDTIDLNNFATNQLLQVIMSFDKEYTGDEEGNFEVAWMAFWMLNRSTRWNKLAVSCEGYKGLLWNVKKTVSEFMRRVKTDFGKEFLAWIRDIMAESYHEFVISTSVASVNYGGDIIKFCVTPVSHEVYVSYSWGESDVFSFRPFTWKWFIEPLIQLASFEEDLLPTFEVLEYIKMVPKGHVENASLAMRKLAATNTIAMRLLRVEETCRAICRVKTLCSLMSDGIKTINIKATQRYYDDAGQPVDPKACARIEISVSMNDASGREEEEFWYAVDEENGKELTFSSVSEAWEVLDGIMVIKAAEMAKGIMASTETTQHHLDKLQKNSVERFVLENYYLNHNYFKGLIWA